MKTELVNGEFEIALPEGFEVLTKEELQKYYRNTAEGSWGITDRERNIYMFVLWQKVNPLFGWLQNPKSMAKANEKGAAKGYGANGYEREGFITKTFGTSLMEGYRFRYKVNDEVRHAETLLVRRDGTVYNITFICGEKELPERDNLLLEMLKTW